MSIHDMVHKINRGVQDNQFVIIYISIVVIVGFCSFLLGRLSLDEGTIVKSESVKIIQRQDVLGSSVATVTKGEESPSMISNVPGGKYLASKNGKLYYSADCKAANRIKPENVVWFDQASDAEKLGYSPSSSCK